MRNGEKEEGGKNEIGRWDFIEGGLIERIKIGNKIIEEIMKIENIRKINDLMIDKVNGEESVEKEVEIEGIKI